MNLIMRNQVMNEETYLENVEYYMRILTLLTDTEINLIKESWSLVRTTEGLFENIFYRMITENQSLRSNFVGLDGISDEMLTENQIFKDHNYQVIKLLSAMVENIQNPNCWMLDVLRAATFHRMSRVKLSYFTDFKTMFMRELKHALDDNFSREKEELWDRVFDCVVGFMNQSLDK